jgi:hypothetical protein
VHNLPWNLLSSEFIRLLHLTLPLIRIRIDGGFSAGLNILLSNISTTVKRTYPLGNNKFIELDSYPEHNVTVSDRVANFFMATVVVVIAALTAGAMVGVDITNPQTWSNQDAHRISR